MSGENAVTLTQNIIHLGDLGPWTPQNVNVFFICYDMSEKSEDVTDMWDHSLVAEFISLIVSNI